MNTRSTIITGAASGALSVIFGAFGAHALKATLAATGRADVYELAVRYQFYHSFAILLTGILMNHYAAPALRYAGMLFAAGILVFSGSLYALALSGKGFLGAITPVGGLAFIAGWVCIVAGMLKKKAAS